MVLRGQYRDPASTKQRFFTSIRPVVLADQKSTSKTGVIFQSTKGALMDGRNTLTVAPRTFQSDTLQWHGLAGQMSDLFLLCGVSCVLCIGLQWQMHRQQRRYPPRGSCEGQRHVSWPRSCDACPECQPRATSEHTLKPCHRATPTLYSTTRCRVNCCHDGAQNGIHRSSSDGLHSLVGSSRFSSFIHHSYCSETVCEEGR